MRITSVSITNFRSFRKTQTFDFPERLGLFFMQGINEAEPRLEANGAGKSTIWEAITWCIFGKTSRGLKAGDVANWEAGKGTVVEIEFVTEDGEEASMHRSWKPNTWGIQIGSETRDLSKGEANWFMEMLGLDYQPWLSCVLTAQNQPMFLDMKAEAQAALFSEVMKLDSWLARSERAGIKSFEMEGSIRLLERDLAAAIAGIKAREGDDLREAHRAWEEERSDRLARMESSYEQGLEAVTPKQDVADAEAEVIKLRKGLRDKIEEAEAKLKKAKHFDDRARELTIKLHTEEGGMKRQSDHIRSIREGKECPTCGFTIQSGKREELLREGEERLSEIAGRCLELAKLVDKAELVQLEAGAEAKAAQRLVEDARTSISNAEYEARQTLKRYEGDQRALDNIEAEHAALKKAPNPYDALMARQQADIRSLRQERDELQHKLDRSMEKQSLYKMWVKGFKELRLQLIAEALTELEIEVNSCVTALGLTGWELNFQVDRESKGGSIHRGFSVLVRAPGSPALVPWAAWSGGEAQRLRLAGNMGLADLIRSRSGVKLDLEIWDEPTQGLSPQGAEDLLESLAHRARQEHRQIWIIDHRTHAFGGFAGGATIIKTPSGSRIQQV